MDYHLSSLGTLLVFIIAMAIGIVSAMLLKDGRKRFIWSVFVAVIFTLAALSAVIFEFSWMFSEPERLAAQAVALCAAMTGLIYAVRVNG
jgi:hypothetical protein